VDFVLESAETIVESGGQIVVLGRGEPEIEKALHKVQTKYPRSIAVSIGFEDGEARRIFAASDFTLLPSRFEPCGLSQMYAQRFGSLPIGRKTGGLAETITDGQTGFLFPDASPESFLSGIVRAFATYGSKRSLYRMRESAMAQTFSWTKSASSYGAIYRNLTAA